MIALGVDCGGTGSRWMLINADKEVLARGKLPAISGNSFSKEDFPRDWQDFLDELTRTLPDKPDCVVLAGTGLHPKSRAIDRLHAALSQQLVLDSHRVLVTSDMPMAYRSILQPGEGILVYSGTGSVVHHVNSDGISTQIGGYGEYIDDAGSGFWIGQHGLRHALRFNDAGKKSILSEEVFKQLGVHTWPEVWAYVYGSSQIRGGVAIVANAVGRAAEQNDEYAQDILNSAGAELAKMVLLLLDIVTVNKIGLLGGALTIPLVRQSLIAHLPNNLSFTDDAIEPVEAAARWALTLTD